MGAGLIGNHIRRDSAPHNLGKEIRRVAQQADRCRFALILRLCEHGQGFIKRIGRAIQVARTETTFDARQVLPCSEDSDSVVAVLALSVVAVGVCAEATVASKAVPANAAVRYFANIWFSP